MLSTKKILVCSDGSAIDDTLINFISFVLKTSPAEDIYFMNVVSSLDDLLDADFKKLDKEVLEAQKKQIHQKIKEKIPVDINATLHVVVKKGNAFKEVLKFLEKEDIDVVISGHKKTSKGSGTFNTRLARRAPCNIIVVPEGYKPKSKKLLLPIDFSEHSKMALEYAMYISDNNNKEVEIICQNIYSVPTGYHYSGNSYEEFADIMMDNAKKEYTAWILRMNTGGHNITAEFSLNDKDNFGKVIQDMALKKEVSGIIIGAKGRTAASALFIGSTAEKLIAITDYLPLTIVRKKGSNATVIESIKEL